MRYNTKRNFVIQNANLLSCNIIMFFNNIAGINLYL